MRIHGTACVIACVLAASPAAAQDTTEEARLAFEAGREAFANGRFGPALEYFDRAYALTQHPDILYDIGHTADRARQDARALEAFEAFLEARPESDERPAIETRMATLRRAIAERASTVEPETEPEAEADPEPLDAVVEESRSAPETPELPARSRQEGSTFGGWLTLGAGLGVAALGGALLGVAEVRASEVRSAQEGTPWPLVRDAHRDADSLGIAGGVLLGIGLTAAAVGSIVAVVLEMDSGIDVAVGPTHLSVRGSF